MKSVQISFRLTEEEAHQLDQRRAAESRGEYSRQVVLAAIDGQETERLSEELARLREELGEQFLDQHGDTSKTHRRLTALESRLASLREEIANAVGGVLMNMGRNLNEEQAAEFVRVVFPEQA